MSRGAGSQPGPVLPNNSRVACPSAEMVFQLVTICSAAIVQPDDQPSWSQESSMVREIDTAGGSSRVAPSDVAAQSPSRCA